LEFYDFRDVSQCAAACCSHNVVFFVFQTECVHKYSLVEHGYDNNTCAVHVSVAEETAVNCSWWRCFGVSRNFLAVGAGQEGDTLLGCGLCLVASLAYTLNAVLVQKFVDPHRVPVLRLLGYEGLLPLATLVVVFLGATTLAPLEWHDWFSGLPSFTWLLLLGILSLCLNIGWLWCTETAGAFFAAMVGCLSIPCSMLLDALLFDQWPTIRGGCGAVLVFLGFLVVTYNSTEEADEPTFDRNGNLAPRIHVCSKCDLMSCSWCTCHCRTMPLLGGASLT